MDTAKDGGRARLRGPSIVTFCTTGRAGAQFLSNLRRMMTYGHLSKERWTCTCPPGVAACFQTSPDLFCSHPSFYTLPWTLSCNHNSSPIFSIRASVVCLLWPSVREKKRTVSTLNGTGFFHLQRITLRACLHDAHNRIHACVLILLLWQEFQFYTPWSNHKMTRLLMDVVCLRFRTGRLIYDFVIMWVKWTWCIKLCMQISSLSSPFWLSCVIVFLLMAQTFQPPPLPNKCLNLLSMQLVNQRVPILISLNQECSEKRWQTAGGNGFWASVPPSLHLAASRYQAASTNPPGKAAAVPPLHIICSNLEWCFR